MQAPARSPEPFPLPDFSSRLGPAPTPTEDPGVSVPPVNASSIRTSSSAPASPSTSARQTRSRVQGPRRRDGRSGPAGGVGPTPRAVHVGAAGSPIPRPPARRRAEGARRGEERCYLARVEAGGRAHVFPPLGPLPSRALAPPFRLHLRPAEAPGAGVRVGGGRGAWDPEHPPAWDEVPGNPRKSLDPMPWRV